MEGTINHIFETLNLQGFLLNTINYGVKKLGCAGGSVFLFEGATGKLELYAHTYTYPEKLYSIIKPGKGIIGEAFIKNERVIIDKSSIDEDSVLYKMPKNESRKAIVAIPSSSEALFCFDFVDKNGKMSGLLSKEIEAVENLNKEINSQAFVKKLLNTRFQQALLDLHTAGEGPGNLRQAVNDFLTELPSICTRAGKPKPNLAYIQLVDRRRGVIRTIQGFGLPLSFQSSISHSLEDKDIQSYTVQSQNFHLIVGNDERLHQEIYEKYHHSNLVRLWLPLFPVPQSWLMEKPGQSLDLMLMNQLGWEDKDYKDKEGTVIGKKRIGQWKHGCQLPSRLVYGTLEIGFQRTKEEFSFEPFTSELIHWYIAQAYKMSENLYRATLDGSLESIGHITASASGANKTNFSVTMSEWGNLEERVYPITTDFCAAEPEKIPISQPAMKTPAKIQFYNDENIEEHASKMQKILKEIAEKAAHLALRLDDYASDPYLLMEEVEDHSNLGTLYPDKGIKPVLQEMSRGVGATHCILYLFEEETTSNSNSSAKSEINMNFLGVLGEWPEDKVGAQFAIPKKESLEKEEIINLASGVAKKKKSSKAMPFENTKQLAALLPLELSDKTTAVLVFIFPGNVSKNDIKLGVFESRIARWIHRLSLRRMVQADQFSLAMHKLRKSIGYAREGASHEKETRHIEAYGKKIMQDFLEQFAALGILFSIYNKSVTGPSLVERFWCCRPFNKKSFAGCDIFLGTPASSPGLTALEKSDLVIYSPMDEKRFLETSDLNMELLTKVDQYREHNKTEQADSLKRIVDLIEEPRSTMLVIPVSSFSKSGGNINGAIAIFLMGEHQFNETQRSIIREAGTLTAEALGQMRRLDQQSFAATQSKRFEYLRNQFGMSSTPDDLVMHFFKGMGRKLNIENSKGNETINWNLENVVIWLMSKDSKIKELVARPNGGHKLVALKGKQVIGHDQHPLLRSELKNVEIIENEFPRLANFRIKTFSLTDDKTHFIRETYATFGKKWLLTFPILDADGKVRGVTDFLMDDPLLPEQEAALHSALHEISILFCHSLDNCRYKQVESFSQKVTGIISEKLIRNETWDVFIPRLEKFKKEKLEDWDFMGMSGVLWTGYQLRPSEESKPMTTQNDQAMIWINQQMKTKSEKKSNLPLYYDIMGFLIKGKYLSKQLTDEIIEKLKLSNIVERKAVLVTLEHAWQLIKEMSFPNNDIDIHDIKNDIEALFLLTDKLMIEELSRKSKAIPSNDESPEINFPLGSELNRNLLRLYLASLLLNASRLRNRYVGLNEDNYPYLVPREVRRQFMVNLSRYILGVIEIIEKDNDVDIEPHLVSRVEFLDSLLYLIDRYAHVELRVEECINIREHLGRGLTAEIEHHLNQTFYRDHLLHVIDVFLIGHLLLNANFTWLNEKDQSFIGHISELMITSQRKTTEDLMRQWAAAALLHDIGYQLDFKRNPEIHRSFFNLSNGTYLNWLNANAESKGKNLKEFAHQLFTGFSNFNNSDEWLPKNNESLNLCDHGIIGSLRLAQVLVHAEAQGIPGGKLNDSRLLEQYSNTLHAISHHNLFNHEVSFMRYPLTCLLRICDELQEWGRRRVNIEQIVKHLYLKIEDIDTKELPSAENLERMETNLDIRSDMEGKLKISLKSEPCNPAFLFRLKYRNPMEVHLDTTTTFLSKAYNLQHVDMEIDTPGSSEPLVFRIELVFPYPVEYFGLTELDIYGLYTENIRSLPLLLVSSNINKAPGGLVQLKSSEKKPSSDRVGIILMGGADSKDRKCWLPCDPASFFDDFFKFKKNILQNRSQDARKQDKS